MNADHLYEGSGAADGRYRAIVRRKRGVGWVMIGQGMGGDRIVCRKGTSA